MFSNSTIKYNNKVTFRIFAMSLSYFENVNVPANNVQTRAIQHSLFIYKHTYSMNIYKQIVFHVYCAQCKEIRETRPPKFFGSQ